MSTMDLELEGVFLPEVKLEQEHFEIDTAAIKIEPGEAQDVKLKPDPLQVVKTEFQEDETYSLECSSEDGVSASRSELCPSPVELKTDVYRCSGCTMTFLGLVRKVTSSKETLVQFITEHGVVAHQMTCVKCQNIAPLQLSDQELVFCCASDACGFSHNARPGTLFETSQLQVEKMIEFVTLWCLMSYQHLDTMKCELQLEQADITHMARVCQKVCESWLQKHREPIGGPSVIVEVDKCQFSTKQLIFGGIERQDKKKFFMVPVEAESNKKVIEIIKDHVLVGSTIITDSSETYKNLQKEGYKHLRMNGSGPSETGKKFPLHMMNVKCLWRNLRCSDPARKNKSASGCLAEFHFKAAHSRNLRVHAFMHEAASMYAPSVSVVGS